MTDANKILVPRHKIMISKIVFFVGFLHTYDLFFNIGQMRFFSRLLQITALVFTRISLFL